MGALRQDIVESVCRVLSVKDRGYARRDGNIIDVLVDAGLDPRLVLQEAAAAADVRVITDRLMQGQPMPWPEGTDIAGCVEHGIVAVAKLKSGAWCFAYTDPEVAKDAARYAAKLHIPAHRAVLALRTQVAAFFEAAMPDPFQATPTQVVAAPDPGTLDEVSADSDAFDPSAVDDAPIPEPSPAPAAPGRGVRFADADAVAAVGDTARNFLGGDTMADVGGDAGADDVNGAAADDDDEFYVDTSDRLARPPTKATPKPPPPPQAPGFLPPPAPSVVRPRAATGMTSASMARPSSGGAGSTTGSTGKPRRPDRHDTGNTGSAPSAPPWNAPPPEQLQIPRTKLLVGAAVVVVIVGAVVSRKSFLAEPPPPAAIIVTPDGMVNAQPAQEDLLAQAMAPGVAPVDAIELLSKCIAFDPESKVGLEAVQARLRLLIAQADSARARRDLQTLERRMGSDEKAAPTLAALSKAVAELEEAHPPLPPTPEEPPTEAPLAPPPPPTETLTTRPGTP